METKQNNELDRLAVDGKYWYNELGDEPGFIVTYETTTPESAENGEYADHGFSGCHSCKPDEYDIEDGLTDVDLAVRYLQDEGVTEASSYPWHPGTWYSTEPSVDDYSTGGMTSRSYHPKNFTADEERAIYRKLFGNK